MKHKFLILLIIFFIPFKIVNANEIEDSLNNLSDEISNIKQKMNNISLLDDKYPVGSIYITTQYSSASQVANAIGGTWESFGAGRTLIGVGSNGTTNYSTASSTGGNSKVTLTTTNIPSHNHTITAKGSVSSTYTGNNVSTNSSGSHTHDLYIDTSGREARGYGIISGDTGFSGRAMIQAPSYVSYSSSAGSHTHTITPSGTVTSTFKGTNASTSSVGSSSSINVQNPYITVYFYKRTK